MDFPFLLLTIVTALFLPRSKALVTSLVLWSIAVAMVGWGPAHSDGVETASLGFWVPWLVVLAIGMLLVLAIAALRARRSARATVG